MGRIMFYGSSGGWSDDIVGANSLFSITSNAGMLLTALSGYLQLQGNVDFSTATSVSGLQMYHIFGLVAALAVKVGVGSSTSSVLAGGHNHGFPDECSSKQKMALFIHGLLMVVSLIITQYKILELSLFLSDNELMAKIGEGSLYEEICVWDDCWTIAVCWGFSIC